MVSGPRARWRGLILFLIPLFLLSLGVIPAAGKAQLGWGGPTRLSAEALQAKSQSYQDLLPKAQQDVIVMRYLQGMSEAEAAEELGCVRGTVSARLSRGLERLRQKLGERGAILSVTALGILLGKGAAEAAAPAHLVSGASALGAGAAATDSTNKCVTWAGQGTPLPVHVISATRVSQGPASSSFSAELLHPVPGDALDRAGQLRYAQIGSVGERQ